MNEAFKQAKIAFEEGEVPVGAVVVSKNKVIARAYNQTEKLNDVTAHAEMQAFTAASQTLGGKYLKNCTLYVTIEPCVMCAGASYWTQINRIVYGAKDKMPLPGATIRIKGTGMASTQPATSKFLRPNLLASAPV